MVHRIIHILLIALGPPLLLGIINRTKAFFAGRKGQPLAQSYRDIFKLMRKGMLTSKTASWIFLAGPAVGLVTTVGAALIIPLGHHPAVLSFPGDMVFLIYLFALGRFFTAVAALDTGSAFEGMGAAREVTFSCLAEPALFLGFLVLVRLTGAWSLSSAFGAMTSEVFAGMAPALAVVGIGWLLVLLAENSRIPFDDPNTHLELTMIHEVMVLDHSGPALGMILYGSAVKLFAIGALLLNVAVCSLGDPWLDWAVFIGAMAVLGVVIGAIESSTARLKLSNIPKVLVSACLLAAFGMLLSLWQVR